MRYVILLVLGMVVGLGVANVAAAQDGKPCIEDAKLDDWYNASRVITVRGPIVGVRLFPMENRQTGVLVRISFHGTFPEAYLGTEAYLHDNDIEIGITRYIAVTGNCEHFCRNRAVVIADTIEMDGVKLLLRNKDGKLITR